MSNTSGYNLRPRRGAKVKSQPTSQTSTQQGRLVRARKNKEHHHNPYIQAQAARIAEEGQQQNCQERKEERTATNPSPWRP
ncbi:hypothetical protein TNCV_1637021 [Trichonephila clavipes]|nr:hypothetical protein TNCV_1637021 [Trichonephila clavipes]